MDMPELELRVRRPMRPVTLEKLQQLSSFEAALAESATESRLQDKSLAIETGTDPALFSRIKAGDAGVKGRFLLSFMDACGTELPLMWLLHHRGYDVSSLRKRQTETEAQLAQALARLDARDQELETIKRFVRDTRGAG